MLKIYTIYCKPPEHPNSYIAREWTTEGGKEPLKGPVVAEAATLEGVREQLPPGLACITRNPGDDPSIVENWL